MVKYLVLDMKPEEEPIVLAAYDSFEAAQDYTKKLLGKAWMHYSKYELVIEIREEN